MKMALEEVASIDKRIEQLDQEMADRRRSRYHRSDISFRASLIVGRRMSVQ